MKTIENETKSFDPIVEEGGTDGELCSVGFICVEGGGLVLLALLAHL